MPEFITLEDLRRNHDAAKMWRFLKAAESRALSIACDCQACRASAFPPILPAARTIHGAAAQEAAKPQTERKAPKPRPRSIAEEWEGRR